MRLVDADVYADEMRVKQNECQKLIAEARKNNSPDADHWSGVYAVFVEAKLTLDSIPTVDAVPVVRCKDCKHLDQDSRFCFKCMDWVKDTWFCANGERRESE